MAGYPNESLEVSLRRLVTDAVERCKTESGVDQQAAEAKIKELLSSDMASRSARRSAIPAAKGPGADSESPEGCGKPLEQERVVVEEGFEFTWHRPPVEEVERQAADLDTVRIFLNGCFDLMHVGHFNVIRQAKATMYAKGYKNVVLVVGIHSDAAITGQKGPPLQNDDERIALLQATKWLDEIVTDLPYVSMSVAMADRLRVNFICHGDDMPVVKGAAGMYTDCIEKDRFQLLKRTEGVSTTQILERLLRQSSGETSSEPLGSALATTQRLSQFAAPSDPWRHRKVLAEAKRVVYVDGTFDLLHAGQVTVLEQAARLGDFLLVGLHADEVVSLRRGSRPVLSMLERAMSVLSVKVVDDVVLDAPWDVTRELLTSMNVSVVVAGNKPHPEKKESTRDRTRSDASRSKHDVAKALGIFTLVESKSSLTIDALRDRFLARREQISKRNSGLFEKEMSYVEKKTFVPEA